MHHGDIDKNTAKGLLALTERIKRAKIPPSKLDETLNVATWNIRELGKKRRLKPSLHFIAEIIGQFDLVSVVELRDEPPEAARGRRPRHPGRGRLQHPERQERPVPCHHLAGPEGTQGDPRSEGLGPGEGQALRPDPPPAEHGGSVYQRGRGPRRLRRRLQPLFPGKKMTKLELAFQLSDHLPLWVQLNTDDDKLKLEQILNPKRGK